MIFFHWGRNNQEGELKRARTLLGAMFALLGFLSWENDVDAINIQRKKIRYGYTYFTKFAYTSIGFSSHSMFRGKLMEDSTINKYQYEISVFKEKYKKQIDIYRGFEVEMTGRTRYSGFDYLIGAMHDLYVGDARLSVDGSAQMVASHIEQYFAGDGMEYAKAYYHALGNLLQQGGVDIIAHFDLITKFCETNSFFDTTSREYQRVAIEAVEKLAGKIPYFEVNTGAMARGYRQTPYPAPFILKEFKRLGFGAVISTDCHDSRYLDYGYQEATQFLKSYGFKEHYVLTKHGFVPVAL